MEGGALGQRAVLPRHLGQEHIGVDRAVGQHLAHAEGIVGVVGRHVHREGLALVDDPLVEGLEGHRAVHVQHRERHGLRRRVLAVADLELDLEDAVLVVERRPGHQPRLGVEDEAGGQVSPAEGEGIAVDVAGGELDLEGLVLLDRAVGGPREGRRLIDVGDHHLEGLRDPREAVARPHGHVAVASRRQAVGAPQEALADRVEGGAGRQVIGPVDEGIPIGVVGCDGQIEPVALGQHLVGDGQQHGRRVGAAHVDRPGLGVIAAALVEGADLEGGSGRAVGCGRPAQGAGLHVQGGAIGRVDEQEGEVGCLSVGRVHVVAVGRADGRRRARGRGDGRQLVGRHGTGEARRQIEREPVGVGDGHRLDGCRLAREQLLSPGEQLDERVAARREAVGSDQARRGSREAGEGELEGRQQAETEWVGDRDVEEHLAGAAVVAGVGEDGRHLGREVGEDRELARGGRGEAEAGLAEDVGRDGELVVVGHEGLEPEACRAGRLVVGRGGDGDGSARGDVGEGVVGRVDGRAGGVGGSVLHVDVEGDARHAGAGRRVAAGGRAHSDDVGRHDGEEHVDLASLGDVEPRVGADVEEVATGAVRRHVHPRHRHGVDHCEDATLGVADEEQVFEQRARPAEAEARGVVEVEDDLGLSHAVEAQHVAVVGPRRAPEGAVGREGEAVDAGRAEGREGAAHEAEARDAVARGHIEQRGVGRRGQAEADAVAVAGDDLAGVGVELHERAAAGRRPKQARGVEGHVVDRHAERRKRRARRAPGQAEAPEAVAARAAADQHPLAVGREREPQRADAGPRGRDVAREGAGREGLEDRGERRRGGARLRRRHAEQRLLEERIRRRVGRDPRVGQRLVLGLGLGGERPEVDGGVVGGQVDALGRELDVARVVARPHKEGVGIALAAPIDGRGVGGAALPGLVGAAVDGDVGRVVLDARADAVVGAEPLDRIGVLTEVGHGPGGDRRNAVGGVDDGIRVERGVGAVEDAGRCLDLGAGRGARLGLDRVADDPMLGEVGIGEEQPEARVAHLEARQRVDGGEQPQGGAGDDVDAGGDPQDDAALVDQVEVADEGAPILGDVDVDVAQPNVAEAEAPQVEVVVELLHDADLGDGPIGVGRVLEADRVGERGLDGHEVGLAEAGRADKLDGGAPRPAQAEVVGQVGVGGRQLDGIARVADLDHER